VLKNGVLQERQKNTDLEKNLQMQDKRIQELEEIINEKVSSITNM